jgi:hypothetical protein
LDNALQYVSGSLHIDGVPQLDPQIGDSLGTLTPGMIRTVSFKVRVQFEPNQNRIINWASAFFDFRFNNSCYRAGLLSNSTSVTVLEDEEE